MIMTNEMENARIEALRAAGIMHGEGKAEFEHQIELVRDVLDVPVALVSLIDTDRQVFAAHLGLPEPWATQGETPLTHSFCQHVVAQRCPLVVTDSRQNELVRGNLAVADLNVQAYLGVPLALPSGEVVGALAAIDGRPRDWSDRDLARLQKIAHVVADEIATRVTATEWQHLFDKMSEGFILGEVIRDETGKVIDWRYKRVNRAWSDLTGVPAEDVAGRTIRETFPGIEDEWVSEFGDVVTTGQPVRFTRQVGSLGRWYDGIAQPIGPNTFTVLFLEVTARIEAQRKRDALIELGDRLRDAETIEAAGVAASEAMARALHSTRAGFGLVDAEGETVRVLPDQCAPGVASVAGFHSFRDFGSYIDDLKAGRNVIIPDIENDPRTMPGAAALRQIDIRSLVNLPITERGRIVGVVLVHDRDVREFTREELGFIEAVGDRTQAAISKLQMQAQQHILNSEISHRLKNSLALVQAVANQTLRGIAEREPVEAFERRLHALSSAHDILLQRNWSAASMATVVANAVSALGQESRVTIDGPIVELGSRAALSLALLVHELTTNAMKYGALSNEEGRVTVHWSVADDTLSFHWIERGGPEVRQPNGRGFGSRMIRSGLIGGGGVDLCFDPAGFEAHMTAPLSQMQSA